MKGTMVQRAAQLALYIIEHEAVKEGDLERSKQLVQKNWMSFYNLLES